MPHDLQAEQVRSAPLVGRHTDPEFAADGVGQHEHAGPARPGREESLHGPVGDVDAPLRGRELVGVRGRTAVSGTVDGDDGEAEGLAGAQQGQPGPVRVVEVAREGGSAVQREDDGARLTCLPDQCRHGDAVHVDDDA